MARLILKRRTTFTTIRDAALTYAKRGWAVLPTHTVINGQCSCGRDNCQSVGKHPRTPNGVKNATTDKITIQGWWTRWPDANVGIATGEISGLVVLDVDPGHEGDESLADFEHQYGPLPITTEAHTGGGGRHLFFTHPGVTVSNKTGIAPGLDIRGDGGYIIAPPSLHASGRSYEWKGLCHPDDVPLASLPVWLIKLAKIQEQQGDSAPSLQDVIPKGSRNSALTSLAGTMRRRGMSFEAMLAALLKENEARCSPPLSEDEVTGIAKSVARYKPNEGKKTAKNKQLKKQKNITDMLIDLVKRNLKDWFIDGDGQETAYVRFPVQGHLEHWPIRSRESKNWIRGLYYQKCRKGINTDTLNTVLDTLEAIARFEGNGRIKLHNRVAKHDHALWYDLTNELWQAVKIAENGWQVINNPPLLFKRFRHQEAQVLPAQEGDIHALDSFLGAVEDENHKLLIKVYLILCFVPAISHFILVLYGPQGSTKTSVTKWLKRIVDPSVIDTMGMPKEYAELIQVLDHHWVISFDNLSDLSRAMQDVLSRAATGASHSKRKLYTDEDDIVFKFKRCVILNGINISATKPDILDRCLLIKMRRLSRSQINKKEEELNREFWEVLPQILGGIFTTLSKAMAIKNEIKLSELPRMADATEWGYAICEAMGIEGRHFLNAYYENVKFQNSEIISSTPLAVALQNFAEKRKTWEGTSSELLAKLEEIADDRDKRHKAWPKASNVLTRRLNELKTNLEEMGIYFEIIHSGDRRLKLWNST